MEAHYPGNCHDVRAGAPIGKLLRAASATFSDVVRQAVRNCQTLNGERYSTETLDGAKL